MKAKEGIKYVIGAIIFILFLLWVSINVLDILESPSLINWIEENTSSKSETIDLWCLELFNEEDRKSLGYLQGDFLDELVCREDIQNMKKDLENISYSKVKEFFNNP